MKIVPNILDLMLSGIIILVIIMGIFRGFLREILSLIFLGITFILSFIYHEQISNLIFKNSVKESTLADFLGFLTIWLFLFLIGFIVSFIFKKKINPENLHKNDRIFGGIIGFIRGILTAAMVCYSISLFGISSASISKSSIMSVFSNIIDHFLSGNPLNLSSLRI